MTPWSQTRCATKLRHIPYGKAVSRYNLCVSYPVYDEEQDALGFPDVLPFHYRSQHTMAVVSVSCDSPVCQPVATK